MTAKLVLSLDGLVLKEIALDKERMSVGRKPHNDIQIDNLAISGEHAAIITILNDSFLEDLNSTNGTMVNGQAIKKHFLQNGDVVELGKYKLKYINEKPAHGEPADFNVDALSPGFTPGQGAAPAPAPETKVPAERRAVVKILSGSNAGKELELVKALTTLGKPGVQVAVINRRPQGFVLSHMEGPRMPSVNGEPLGDQPRTLADGDLIEVAGVRMEFRLTS